MRRKRKADENVTAATITTGALATETKLKRKANEIITAATIPMCDDLASWPLTDLKRLACAENLDEGWQHISKEHRAELLENLVRAHCEAHEFLSSVRASATKIQNDAISVSMTEARGK